MNTIIIITLFAAILYLAGVVYFLVEQNERLEKKIARLEERLKNF